jgi:hypothetical protein
VKKAESQVKEWTKPATDSLIGGTAGDLVKSKEQLIMENALVCQQVIVLKRLCWLHHTSVRNQAKKSCRFECGQTRTLAGMHVML